MRSFWHNLFQPAEKARPEPEKPQPSSLPPPPPQASAPRFELYPPPTRQWAFADDAAGQRLRSLWRSVLTATGGPLVDRIDFLPFVTALRHACERNKSTPAPHGFKLETVPPPTESQLHPPAAHSARTAGSDRASLREPPSIHVLVDSEARGVPVDVVHGLAEAVLSAAVCRSCGYRLTVDASRGCTTHGLEGTIAWRPVLRSDEEENEGDGSIFLAPFPLADAPGTSDGSINGEQGPLAEQRADGGVAEADGRGRRSDEEQDGGTAVTGGLARRRDCLAETLGALSVATQWSHTREELARRDRAGGGALVKGLASLLSALCELMATLRSGQQGMFGKEQLRGGSNEHSAWHDDALFFLRCLVHLARIVSNSTPAASALYKLVNDSTLPGTGLPDHPWPRGASDGPILPCCIESTDYFGDLASGTKMRKTEAAVASGDRTSDGDSNIKALEDNAGRGHGNSCGDGSASRNNAASYVAMSLMADSDEWSAGLVSAGLVQSLVHSLEACLELRSLFGKAAETRAVKAGGPSRQSCTADYFVQNPENGDGGGYCLGCWLAVAQVEVLLAIGSLLSAHPLAARDRFQLAGGVLTFRQMISTLPYGGVANHDCLSRMRPKTERAEGVAGASVSVPFVHEHCSLVAIEVLRLHLRAYAPNPVPADVAEGAGRFIEALPHVMRAVWETYRVDASSASVSSRPPSLPRRGRAHLVRGNSEESDANSDANFSSVPKRSRPSIQPRIFFPLHCPAEDDIQPSGNRKVLSGGADGCKMGNDSKVDGSSTVDGRHTAGRVQGPPGVPSYLLCRPRNSCDANCSVAASPTPTPEVTGLEWNGLQEYARSVGPGAATVVSSLYRRLDSTVDETDVLAPEVGAAATAFASGNSSVDDGYRDGISGGVDEPRERSEYERVFALRVLISFHYGVLGIVADCAVQGSESIADLGGGGWDGVGLNLAAGNVGGDYPRQAPLEPVLRCATRCFLDLIADRDSAWFSDNRRELRENAHGKDVAPHSRFAKDRAVARPMGDSFDTETVSFHPAVYVDQGREDVVAPLTGGNAVRACPVRQLLALKFYLASMRRWPRLTIQVMRKTGVWDALFSDHFLGGCSTSITPSIESRHESLALGTPAPHVGDYRAPEDESGGSCVENIVIGWGLVHDATLVLLEAVMVARQLLRAQARDTGGHSHAGEAARLEGLDRRRDVPDEPLEVGEYIRFLTGAKNGRVSAVVAIQGCAWLRDAFAREATLSGGFSLLSRPLRGASLRLAFTLCNSAQEGGSRISRTVAWPLLHGSLSLAVELVSADNAGEEGVLFQAAVAFFTAAEVVETRPATGPGISCIHRPTASLTSDASTHGMHVLSASWTVGSVGSSGTAAGDNTDSPRIRPTFSFGDIQLPPPQPPPPITEILFKSALDVRVRRAAFYIAARLGVQAGRIGLSSTEKVVGSSPASEELHGSGAAEGALQINAGGSWAMRVTAAEVLSGLVEGYLCLCERAAAVIVAATSRGEGSRGDGLVLLIDALRGARALIHGEESWFGFATCAGGTNAISGANARASTHVQKGNSGLSPLLQEAFREHWASSRLLVVLERVAGSIAVDKRTSLSAHRDLIERYSEAVVSCLSLFTTLMTGNSLGKQAFGRAIANHCGVTESLGVAPATPGTVTEKAGGAELRESRELNGQRTFVALAPLTSVVPAAPLLRALMEMLMDGDIPDSVSQRMETDRKLGAGSDGAGRDGGVGGGWFVRGKEARARENVDGQYPPEIRNPLVVPLVFTLLPKWPILEKRRAMEAFRFLLRGIGGGIANRSMCCDVQPPLMDQLLDMLPRLDEGSQSDADGDELQRLVMDLIWFLGSHSITVAQLKKIFRLMQPLHAADVQSTAAGGAANVASASFNAPLQPPWLCGLLTALRGMMDDKPGPQRFFLLDGISSGLRLPPMPRWPAPRGYTFCAWVRLEAAPSARSVGGGSVTSPVCIHAPPVAGAPCLFSFCGERGQGVAACFIPLRKGHGREPDAAAAATTTQPPSSEASAQTYTEPRQYALELRVGAGRKKLPAVVRFPGALVTAEKWVFVAVAHAPRSWGQRGEAAVLVDNCWRVVASPFPRFHDGGVPAAAVACHCPHGMDGDATENCGVGARLAGRPELCSLRGQMGPVYLFAGNLSEELLRGIRQLGPDYAFSFEPPQVDSRGIALLRPRDPRLRALSEEIGAESGFTEKTSVGGGGSGERQMETASALAAAASAASRVEARQKLHKVALSGALTPLILLAYNPSVWGGEYFLDNTPDHNDVKWTDGSHRGGRVIYSMSGSQAHVLIQPRHAVSSARGGDDRGGETKTSDSSPRERGWSGVSGEDNFFGNNEYSTFGRSSSSVHPRPRPGCMHAMRLPGTRECVTRDVRDALDCLGGVKVLLPLFAQYDHGVLRSDRRVSYQTGQLLNETVLALLAGTLRDSVPNRHFLRQYDGLSLIHHCLERVSPQHMTAGALAEACRLTDRLGSWSEDWANSAIAYLLAPSRLWVFAPPDAQLTLAGVLRGLARRCPGRMRRVVGLQRCLDALDLYYWYTPPNEDTDGVGIVSPSRESNGTGQSGVVADDVRGASVNSTSGSNDWSHASRQWLNPSTGELLGLKASGAPLREIRARLLDAAALMVCDGDGVGKADVAAVLGFLRGCRDSASRCEALRLVLRLADDPRQAARFAVASGYVATDISGGDDGDGGGPLGGRGSGGGPGRGGAAVAVFLTLVRASDPTVRLLALLALAQVLIACLRIEDGSSPSGCGPSSDDRQRQDSSASEPKDVAAAASTNGSGTAYGAEATVASLTTVVVGFMGGADAKAEELALLTGAAAVREGRAGTSANTGEAQSNGEKVGGFDDVLELRGGAWEHVGLPRDRVLDVLLWAQRQVTRASGNNAGEAKSNGFNLQGSWGVSSFEPQDGLHSEAATERTVARVTLGVLQGLLVGELPPGFVASVVSLSDGRERQEQHAYTTPVVAPPRDITIDPFFWESRVHVGHTGPGNRPTSWRHRGQGASDGSGVGNSGAGRHPGSRPPRPGRNGSRTATGAKPDDATSVTLPLLIRLPEAFPALCQQVATAPEGAAPRDAVIETLVASAHDLQNAKAILSVDSWQQYLLSVVSSAQGRQAVAVAVTTAAANSSTGGLDSSSSFGEGSHRGNRASKTAKSKNGDRGCTDCDDDRTARNDACEDGRLVDQTVRLICWLAMCEVREGVPGRPGAGFAALQDTMSFLRCQAELGAMECVSVGERVLRHMMSLLKREADALESEVNGWARVWHHPSLRPRLGGGGNQGAAAVLACVWPLASLVVEFIAIPPVSNPPAAAAFGAPTPAAAALAVVAAAADGDRDSPSHWSDDSLTCPSPMQGILQWLDTGMKLPRQTSVLPLTPSSPSAQGTAAASAATPRLRVGSSPLSDAAAASTAGWRAWELLDAAVDLVGPMGDTLLWDARYRHNLSVVAGVDAGILPIFGAVDPSAAKALDWGRQELNSSGRDDTRLPRTPGAPRQSSGGFLGGVRGAGGVGGHAWFVDAKGKGNPLADAGGVPWMLVRLLLAVFVSGGASESIGEGGAAVSNGTSRPVSRRGSFISNSSGASGSSHSVGSGKGGGGGGGSGPPSIALFALQRLIALLNSLEASGYKCYEFEVLNVAARVSTALRNTQLTPRSAWVLGALQLLAKCLAAQAAQIEGLLVAAEARLDAKAVERKARNQPSPSTTPVASAGELPPAPHPRLIFRRHTQKSGWWPWSLLPGAGGGPKSRRHSTPKGVLHQIAAETSSLATFPTADLTLEIIRRTLGIELPGQRGRDGHREREGRSNTKTEEEAVAAARLTWDLMEAAFEPISEEGAGQEASGLLIRLDPGGMHAHALQVLGRVRALEGRGVEAGVRVPASVWTLTSAVMEMEARRVSALTETEQRASHRRQAQWEAVLKQLATERGPWGRGVEAADLNSVYWMLNPREDDRGRRLTLIRNPNGCRHTIASERTRGVTRSSASLSRSLSRTSLRWGWRGTAPLSSILGGGSISVDIDSGTSAGGLSVNRSMSSGHEQQDGQELVRLASRGYVRAISAQTSLWQDLCKYQHKSVKVKDGEDWDDDDDEESEEDEEQDEEYHSEESRAEANGEEDGQDGARKGRKKAEAGGGAAFHTQATFSSPADVVRPFCTTPGIVSLFGNRLVFTRSPEVCVGGKDRAMESRFGNGGGGTQGEQTMSDNYRWALRPAPSTTWPTSGLQRVLFRQHGGLRFAALELWFRGGAVVESGGSTGGAEGSSLLLGLPSEALARTLHKELKRTRPPALESFLGRLPATVVSRSKAGTWGASGAGGVGMSNGSGGGEHGSAAVTGRAAATTATAAREAARTPLTDAWVRRRCGVTNFDYLRGLNAAAGRTTADLSRYPVFPWVLSERAWRAKELDLKDERNFRDLAWPMGAQRPEQRETLHKKYEEMERSYLEMQRMGGEMADLALPPFHHGSHYSSSAYVLWYLMRLEPFTSLHIHLQDGRFDKPDRLFQSLPDAYSSCTRNPSDVKEAIPELYYLPEMLVNGTGLDLGRPQCSDKPLGDVELPPWAHGDPWECIRRHREALESEYVSLRLHKWIDLVFGCRQRPPALSRGWRGAVERCNVFFHLTYPGAVDLPRLREQDPQLYASTMNQIEEFGQAPAQLFPSPHPPRLSLARAKIVRPLASPVPGANAVSLSDPTSITVERDTLDPSLSTEGAGADKRGRRKSSAGSPHGVVSYPRERVSLGAILVVCDLLPWAERLVTVDARRGIGYHGWQSYSPERSPPFRLRADTASIESSVRRHGGSSSANNSGSGGGGGSQKLSRRLGVPFAPAGAVSSRLLEPPPSSGDRVGGCIGDSGGDSGRFSPLLGGLGGSSASLASMGSLLSLSQSPRTAEPPQPHAKWPPPLSAFSSARSSPLARSEGWGRLRENVAGAVASTAAAAAAAGVSANSSATGERRAPSGGIVGIAHDVGGADGLGLGSHLFAVHAKGGLLFSGGYWDSSFRVTALDTGRLVVSVARHSDVVTSLSLADGGVGCRRLVTASRDTTLMVWDVEPWSEPPVSASSLLHVLYGHDTPVTCAFASASLDSVVSSGEDGTIVVHSLWGGEYVRTIVPRRVSSSSAAAPSVRGVRVGAQEVAISESEDTIVSDERKEGNESGAMVSDSAATSGEESDGGGGGGGGGSDRARKKPTTKAPSHFTPSWPSLGWVGLSSAGYIVSYSQVDATLRSYSINGQPLGVAVVSSAAGPLRAFAFSEDGSVLLSGGDDRVVTLRWAHSLALADDGGREGCGEAVLTGAAPPLAGVPGASAGVEKFGSAIRCLALTAGERHLLVGLEDGTMGVLALDANYLRQRLMTKLDQLGF